MVLNSILSANHNGAIVSTSHLNVLFMNNMLLLFSFLFLRMKSNKRKFAVFTSH